MKKKGGGQVTHGGKKFLRTGILPKGKLHIGRLVDGVTNEMIQDLGGEDEITASQKIIISAIRQNLIFLSLISEWIAAQPSIVDKGGQVLGPLSGIYLACQNAVTRNCRELGFKRFGPADLLEKYLEAKARAAGADEPGELSSKQTGAELSPVLGQSGEGNE